MSFKLLLEDVLLLLLLLCELSFPLLDLLLLLLLSHLFPDLGVAKHSHSLGLELFLDLCEFLLLLELIVKGGVSDALLPLEKVGRDLMFAVGDVNGIKTFDAIVDV